MDELDRHRPLADGRGHPLDRPARTSPAANTPGRLVSSRNGDRFAVQCLDEARLGPVVTNCLASRSISAGSQSVRGTAPMKLKTAGDFSRFTSFVFRFTSSTCSSDPSPSSRRTTVLRNTRMFGVDSTRPAR